MRLDNISINDAVEVISLLISTADVVRINGSALSDAHLIALELLSDGFSISEAAEVACKRLTINLGEDANSIKT